MRSHVLEIMVFEILYGQGKSINASAWFLSKSHGCRAQEAAGSPEAHAGHCHGLGYCYLSVVKLAPVSK